MATKVATERKLQKEQCVAIVFGLGLIFHQNFSKLVMSHFQNLKYKLVPTQKKSYLSKNSIDIHSHVFDDEYQTDLDVTVETLPDDGRIGVFILFVFS